MAGAVGVEPTSSGSKPDAVTVALRPNILAVINSPAPHVWDIAGRTKTEPPQFTKKERKNNNDLTTSQNV